MDEQTHIQIDQYLSGELLGEALVEFEQKIKGDPDLAQEIDLQRDIQAAFQEPEIVDLEQKLSDIMAAERKAADKTASLRPLRSRPVWSIAASVVLVAGIGFLLYRLFQPAPTPDQLYLAYAELPERMILSTSMRSLQQSTETDSLAEAVQAIEQLYQSGEAEAAMSQLETLASSNPALRNAYASLYHFLKGILHLKLTQWQAARSAFQQISSGEYAEEADWFDALLALKLEGNSPQVRTRIQQFTDYPNPHQEAAKDLLGELE